MPVYPATIFDKDRGRQHGAAMLIMLVILIISIAAVLVRSLSLSSIKSARQATTAAALSQAKNALLGRAVSDVTLPGSLPCPDTNDDGSAELLAGNDCPSYIGRLPWKTLGLPELRDGSGEHLWYALSPAFRDDNSAQPLNSNTKGALLVYGPDGITLQTQAGYSAVAVIFSPGDPVGSQQRNSTAQQNDPANYLDTANGRNNASVGGPFIAGSVSPAFNDQLLLITTHDLVPPLEKRVAVELKRVLGNYYSINHYYPWADLISSAASYGADYGLNRGWLSDDAATGGTPDWPTGTAGFAPWFMANQWNTLIYYSVGKNYTSDPFGCSSCSSSSTLSVDGSSGVRVLFFMPGTYSGTRAIDNLSEYLEDAENNDNSNDLYVTPTSQNNDRDRLYRFTTTWIP